MSPHFLYQQEALSMKGLARYRWVTWSIWLSVVHLGWFRAGMGKLRPAGHIRPVGLLNPARRILVQNCPNYSKDRIHFAFFQYPAFQLIPLDGALSTQFTFAGVWSILSAGPTRQPGKIQEPNTSRLWRSSTAARSTL